MKLKTILPKVLPLALVTLGCAAWWQSSTEQSEATRIRKLNNIPPGEYIAQSLTCPDHLPYGAPTGTPSTNNFIVRDIYCLSSNDATKFADYVAYRLDRSNLDCPDIDQSRGWKADPAIAPAETLEPADYTGAYAAHNYDRGHLAPLASFRCKNWEQVNYLSNITPQKASLNRGAWKELEDYERDLVWEHGEVYVITGTLQQSDQPAAQLPQADETHDVPEGFWKIIMYNGKLEAYIMPQWYTDKDWKAAIAPLSEVEQYTGLYLQFLLNHYQESNTGLL